VLGAYHQERPNNVGLVDIQPLFLRCVLKKVALELFRAVYVGRDLARRNSCIVDEDVQVLLLRLNLFEELPMQ
jgi:hypothetical protein